MIVQKNPGKSWKDPLENSKRSHPINHENKFPAPLEEGEWRVSGSIFLSISTSTKAPAPPHCLAGMLHVLHVQLQLLRFSLGLLGDEGEFRLLLFGVRRFPRRLGKKSRDEKEISKWPISSSPLVHSNHSDTIVTASGSDTTVPTWPTTLTTTIPTTVTRVPPQSPQ